MACRPHLLIISITLASTFGVPSFSQTANSCNDIEGYYWCKDPFTGEETQNVIYQSTDGSFESKVVWVKNLKLAHYIGMVFMTGLKFDADTNQWSGGKAGYPGKKSKYSIVAYFDKKKPNKLKLRGYVGVELFGMTTTWIKEKAIRES
ncbi:MAG: DUF2147 domain-containing protein [Bacteroidales bacterium]|jgi:uncharacterized protein (DUF2147 family)|nr:DUF2147 domain-containing protein [Bacteroidales bacterium]